MSHQQNSLFRQEAVDNNRNSWTGSVTLFSRMPAFIVALTVITLLTLFISLITFGHYTRRINVGGEVIIYPHPVDIFAGAPGIVEQRFVDVGQRVDKDTPLYQISASQVTQFGDVNKKKIASVRLQLVKSDKIIRALKKNRESILNNIQQQIGTYNDALKQSKIMMTDSLTLTKEMQRALNEYQQYSRSHLITKDQLNNQRYMYQQQKSTYSNLYFQNLSNVLQLVNLRSDLEIKSAEFDEQILKAEAQHENLQRELAEAEIKDRFLVLSPMAGQVESLVVTEGQMVKSGDTLAQVANNSEQAVYSVFWLPDRARPFVKNGDRVNVRFESFPYEKYGQFSGEIISVSTVPASLQELANYKNSPVNGESSHVAAYYKTVVKFARAKPFFQAHKLYITGGMKTSAVFFLERRPLYQWMFSPLYKIQDSVAEHVHE
ncbi:HlyD family secretion protein [Erwinia sp. HR93]|uniref:HlyD family secretion protein n=1 Tax=Erwinia sp. HR93 TaxID=3094840 RepID=UPI002ADEF2D0|nr:HlyD family secretion protein [Erwinia sp. HR93]MEA1062543.1 HlyD family secretion protein [Erwinia sp. HR93]